MRLELVSHCWQRPYSRLLMYQLSSLLLNPPRRVAVTITVFFTRQDPATAAVVDFFESLEWPSSVRIRPWELARDRLLVRLIGRNLAALRTEADWVWFTDCDYVFGPDALDSLPDALAGISGPLAFPRRIRIHRSHEIGDRAIAAAEGAPRIVCIRPEEFVDFGINRAIGGVQIARGDVVRELGYCRNSRRQRLSASAWQREVEDRHFRVQLGTRGTPIELPQVFRLRHSGRGGTLTELTGDEPGAGSGNS